MLKLNVSAKDLASGLRNKRVWHGLHKYQVARLVGVSVATITKVEDEKRVSAITRYLVRTWVNKKGI